jgi:hypothetical protein
MRDAPSEIREHGFGRRGRPSGRPGNITDRRGSARHLAQPLDDRSGHRRHEDAMRRHGDIEPSGVSEPEAGRGCARPIERRTAAREHHLVLGVLHRDEQVVPFTHALVGVVAPDTAANELPGAVMRRTEVISSPFDGAVLRPRV